MHCRTKSRLPIPSTCCVPLSAGTGCGYRVNLAEFLRETGLELEDVYRSGCWSRLQRDASVQVPAPGPHEALIGDRLAGILHVDDPLRLAAYRRLAESSSLDGLTDIERRLFTGLHFAAIPSRIAPASLAESAALIHAHPAIVQELLELLALLDEQFARGNVGEKRIIAARSP